MYNTVRTCARPPQIVRRPRKVPLSQLSGATPTNAAICWRLRVPNSGTPRRPFHRGLYNDQPVLRVKGDTHNTIAVSVGNVPVYSMANRLGRNRTASR